MSLQRFKCERPFQNNLPQGYHYCYYYYSRAEHYNQLAKLLWSMEFIFKKRTMNIFIPALITSLHIHMFKIHSQVNAHRVTRRYIALHCNKTAILCVLLRTVKFKYGPAVRYAPLSNGLNHTLLTRGQITMQMCYVQNTTHEPVKLQFPYAQEY